jgi:hypothetical protein
MDLNEVKLSQCEELIIGKWQVLWKEPIDTNSEHGDVYLEYCSDGVVRYVLYKYDLTHTIFLTLLTSELGGSGLSIPKILLYQYIPAFSIEGKAVDVKDLSSEQWWRSWQQTVERIKKYHSSTPKVEKQKLELQFKIAILMRHPPGWGYV